MSDRSNGLFIEENRQQRAGLLLRDVCYRLHAELVFIPVSKRPMVRNPVEEELIDPDEKFLIKECQETCKTGKDENPGKYNAMFERRAKKGQCFNQPYLGCREFSANFRLIDENEIEKEQKEKPALDDLRDLGFMLYDMDFSDVNDLKPAFFRANMVKGVIEIPDRESEEVRR